MLFEQFKVEGLGCYSYLIGCPGKGTACVVDPERHVERYIDAAENNGVRITAVFDTHVHADHITGSRELAQKTGADIYIHPAAEAQYSHKTMDEGDSFRFGIAQIDVLYTPGHTPNSVSLALTDHARSKDIFGILTGDLLFVGDVGRPDLAGEDLLEEQITNLYNSLYTKLGRFPDWTEIYPSHGEGSLCGKGMSPKPMTTLGYERRNNPLLAGLEFEEFRKIMISDFQLRPSNFMSMVEKNRQGPELISDFPSPKKLSLDQIETALDRDAVIVDIRTQTSFGAAFIKGSLNIGLSDNSINWLGTLVPADKELVLVAQSESDAKQAVWQFQRAGYDRIVGYIDHGIIAWAVRGNALNHLPQLTAESLKHVLATYPDHTVLDVRTDRERQQGSIDGSVHMPIEELVHHGPDKLNLDKNSHITVVCQSGYRANIAGSFLKSHGFSHVFSLIGGYPAWRNIERRTA